MEPDRKLDARGAVCPGPTVMAAEELENMEPGETLEVLVDSEGVANDIRDLAENKGHKVLRVEETDDGVRILIEVGGGSEGEPEEPATRRGPAETVMIAQSTGVANPERAYATFLIPEAALATGLNVVIFGFMDGVTVLVDKEVRKIKHPQFPPLIEKAEEILSHDDVEAYACELSVQARGITSEDLLDGVEIAGASKFLNLVTDPGVEVVWL